MELIVWEVVVIHMALLFVGIGIFAWKRKKPMWFWSGSEVRKEEISDIPAYNRANGIMWLVYSLVFWLGAGLGFYSIKIAGIVMASGCLGGIPFLVLAYKMIYKKYQTKGKEE